MIKKSLNKRPYDKIIIKPSTIKTVIKPINNNSSNNNITKRIEYNKQEKKNINKKYDINIKRPKYKKFRNYTNISTINPIFKNETIYLIGGGPSLKNFNFELLKNKKTIAINKAFLHVPFANVLYWTDTRVYQWYHKKIDNFKGLKVTNKPNPVKGDILNLLNTGKTGLEEKPNGLRHGNNSGYAAINLAYHLGAKKIILLGYDMKNKKGDTHWHDGYNIPRPKGNLYKSSMIPSFSTIVDPLIKKGVEVLNANMESQLECFTKIPIEKAINY